MSVSHYLLLDKVVVEGANAISSPLTYGFPAITGFLGASHALNRKLVANGWAVELQGVLIACHKLEVDCYRPHPYADYTFNQSRNPIKKDGKTAAIVEEGKASMTVSLVVEVSVDDEDEDTYQALEDDTHMFAALVRQMVLQQRIAGGSVTDLGAVEVISVENREDIPNKLLPAFVLMSGRNALTAITRQLQQDNPDATPLDGLIEVATLHHAPVAKSVNARGWQATSVKGEYGWLVPMPVGYQAIAPQFSPGELSNSRTDQYPSQYVEAIYSLGKWVFPSRLDTHNFSHSFWRYQQSESLYLVTQTTENPQGV